MPDLKAVVVATVDGADLSLHDVLHSVKLKGKLPALIAAAVEDRIIAAAAGKEGISVSVDELQKAADAFRMRGGLSKAADTQRWLARSNLSPDDLEEGLERDLLRQKLTDTVANDKVEKYFAENRVQFDRARLRRIVVEREGVAQELLSRIQEDGADFAELARQHSLDPTTRASGGDLGVVRRQSMPAALATAVFAAKNGDVVGPLATERAHVLIQVEELLPGQLDAATTGVIRQALFQTWISAQVEKSRIEIKLAV